MKQHEPLARATLDTLPMNIAVLDGDGTILFTNRSWDEFGDGAEGSAVDMTGRNYFAGVDMTTDDHASQAVEGIRSVMDGERSLFTLEYPCDTESESKWFLMRVVPLTPDGDQVVVAHIDITDRKHAELRAQERARELQAQRQRLEHLISRVNGLVHDVMEALMGAETTDEVQSALCEQFVSADPYVRAWIAEMDLRTDELVPAAWTGEKPTERSIDCGEADPTARAATTCELQVVEAFDSLPEDSVHRAVCPSARSMAALPLVADETLYGVLTVYADEPGAFDERETVILEALGRTVATAIGAIERKRILTADAVVELELEITDSGRFIFDLSREQQCDLEYAGSVHREAGSYLMFFTVSGLEAETVQARAAEHPDVAGATHVSTFDDVALFEFETTDPPIVSTLADYGAETRSIALSSGTATVEADVAADANVRGIVDALAGEFDSVTLAAYRERERPTQTREEFVSQLMTSLTERQRTALQKAHVGGFFEWPRTTSGEELAASMEITPSTYHQHLRAAQRKLVAAIFDS